MNRGFAGGTPMEAASDFPVTSNEGPKTLEEALDKIRALYKQEQAAKWGQGDQVNQVEEAHLAVKKGYQEARQWVEKELPEMDYKTLYRHASVAKYFSEEHTARWGVSKLQTLITLHELKRRSEPVGDPADLEVQVPRADGSMVAKKFRDCSWRELQSATKQRKQTRKAAGRVIHKDPTTTEHLPKLPSPVLWRPLAMIGLGVVAGFIGDLLQPSTPGWVVSVLSLLLMLGGFAELVRYFASIRDRILDTLKSGAGLRTIKEQGLEVLRSGRKLLAAFKSAEPKATATSTREENPPPPEKKAA